jgi:hypothetical protein
MVHATPTHTHAHKDTHPRNHPSSTRAHVQANPEEQTRILASNGRVERLVDELGQPMGPHRVWLQVGD